MRLAALLARALGAFAAPPPRPEGGRPLSELVELYRGRGDLSSALRAGVATQEAYGLYMTDIREGSFGSVEAAG